MPRDQYGTRDGVRSCARGSLHGGPACRLAGNRVTPASLGRPGCPCGAVGLALLAANLVAQRPRA
jgi:hypothetical protein